jgi:hypothetical protein
VIARAPAYDSRDFDPANAFALQEVEDDVAATSARQGFSCDDVPVELPVSVWYEPSSTGSVAAGVRGGRLNPQRDLGEPGPLSEELLRNT